MCSAYNARSASDIVQDVDLVVDDVWCEDHDKELRKMQKQGRDFLMDAVNRGAVPEEEVDLELLAEAKKRKLTQEKNAKDSMKALVKCGRHLQRSRVDIDASRVEIIQEGTCASRHAEYYVVDELGEADSNLVFMCALLGRSIVNPQYILSEGMEGSAMAFRAAISNRRRVWLSACFRAQHPEMARLLDEAIATPGANMEFVQEVDFLTKMARSNGVVKGYGLIGLVSNELKEDCFFLFWSVSPAGFFMVSTLSAYPNVAGR